MDDQQKTCPECAETIKADAKLCRFCRHRFNDAQSRSQATLSDSGVSSDGVEKNNDTMIVGAIMLVVGACALILMAYLNTRAYSVDPTNVAHEKNEQKAKRLIIDSLIDPESARFKDITADDRCVNGKVNAKNSFGGYVGEREFLYVVNSQRLIYQDEISGDDIDPSDRPLRNIAMFMKMKIDCREGKI